MRGLSSPHVSSWKLRLGLGGGWGKVTQSGCKSPSPAPCQPSASLLTPTEGSARRSTGGSPFLRARREEEETGAGDPRFWSPELVRPGSPCPRRWPWPADPGSSPHTQMPQECRISQRQSQLHLITSMHRTVEARSGGSRAMFRELKRSLSPPASQARYPRPKMGPPWQANQNHLGNSTSSVLVLETNHPHQHMKALRSPARKNPTQFCLIQPCPQFTEP